MIDGLGDYDRFATGLSAKGCGAERCRARREIGRRGSRGKKRGAVEQDGLGLI